MSEHRLFVLCSPYSVEDIKGYWSLASSRCLQPHLTTNSRIFVITVWWKHVEAHVTWVRGHGFASKLFACCGHGEGHSDLLDVRTARFFRRDRHPVDATVVLWAECHTILAKQDTAVGSPAVPTTGHLKSRGREHIHVEAQDFHGKQHTLKRLAPTLGIARCMA